MNCSPTDLLAHDTMVRELLRPLLTYLALPGVSEIVVNRPKEVYIEIGATWQRHQAPDLTLDLLTSLATADKLSAVSSETAQTLVDDLVKTYLAGLQQRRITATA